MTWNYWWSKIKERLIIITIIIVTMIMMIIIIVIIIMMIIIIMIIIIKIINNSAYGDGCCMGKRTKSIRLECEMVSRKVEKEICFRELSRKTSMGLWVQVTKNDNT